VRVRSRRILGLHTGDNNLDLALKFARDHQESFESSARKFLLKGKALGTVDLLVLTSLEQLLFILKILLISFTKQATLMRSIKMIFKVKNILI
jgi:hypothetical protein